MTEEREKEIRDHYAKRRTMAYELWPNDAVGDLLAEIDRLRTENALYLLTYEALNNLVIKNEDKLAKARAALQWYDPAGGMTMTNRGLKKLKGTCSYDLR